MATKAKQTKTTALDNVLKGIVTEGTAKKNLTDTQLAAEIYANLKVSKSAQLKYLRSEGFKVSQARCYTMYETVKAAMVASGEYVEPVKAEETKEEEA